MKKFLSVLMTVLLLVNMSSGMVFAADKNTSIHLKATQSVVSDWKNDPATDIRAVLGSTNLGITEATYEPLGDYYYIPLVSFIGTQAVSDDFSATVTPDINLFIVNGDPVPVVTEKNSDEAAIFQGVEGKGTINYWYDDGNLDLYSVTVELIGAPGSAEWTINDESNSGTRFFEKNDEVALTFSEVSPYYITDVEKFVDDVEDTNFSSLSGDSYNNIQNDYLYKIYTDTRTYDVLVEYFYNDTVVFTGGSDDHVQGTSFDETIEDHATYEIVSIELNGTSTGNTSGPVSISSIQKDQYIKVVLNKIPFDVTVTYIYPDTSEVKEYDEVWRYGDTGNVPLNDFDFSIYEVDYITLNTTTDIPIKFYDSILAPGITEDLHYEVVLKLLPPEIVKYNVIIDGDAGAVYPSSLIAIPEGTRVDLLFGAKTQEGYRLVSVSKVGDEYPASNLVNPSEDTILSLDMNYAYYVNTIKQYDVTVNVSPSGTLDPDIEGTVTYDVGSDISRNFVAEEGRVITSIKITYFDGEIWVEGKELLTDVVFGEGPDYVESFEHIYGKLNEDVIYDVVTKPLYSVKLVLEGDDDSALLEGFEGEALEGEILDYDFTAAAHYDIYSVTVEHGDSTDELVAVDTLEDLVEYLIDGIDEDYVITVYTVKEEYTVTIVSVPEDTIDEHGYSKPFAYLSDETVTFTVKSGRQIDNVTLNGEYQGAITSFDIEDIDEDMDFIVYTSLIPTYGISLDKSSVVSESDFTPKGTFDIGETVTYLFVIKNMGNQYMDYVFFEDEDLGVTREFTQGLAPMGEEGDTISFTLTTSYSASGDKVNHAYVDAYQYYGEYDGQYEGEIPYEPESHAEDSHTVTIRQPYTPPRTVYYTLTLGSTDGGDFYLFEGSRTFPAGTVVDVSYSIEDGYYFVGYSETSDDADVVDNIITMNSNKTLFISFDLEDIPEEVIPESVPEEILDEEITLAAPEIPDEPLPQTGGLPMAANLAVGALVSFAGLGLRRGKRK